MTTKISEVESIQRVVTDITQMRMQKLGTCKGRAYKEQHNS